MKYDYSKVDRKLLEEIAAYAAAMGMQWQLLQQAKKQAEVKTRAEYDKEIGNILRASMDNQCLRESEFTMLGPDTLNLRALVAESRDAKE